MNPVFIDVVIVRRLLLLNILMYSSTSGEIMMASEDKYELNNAIIGDVVRTMENKATVQEVLLSDNQILEMYPELNLTITKGPPVSVMSGKIPDHLIRKMADYLFGLLQGTGEVIKPTTSTTTTTTTPSTSTSSTTPSTTTSPEFLPFRHPTTMNQKFFDDAAVIRDVPKTAESGIFLMGGTGSVGGGGGGSQIRRKPIMRKWNGVSRRKSEKLWRKARMVKVIGRI